MNVPSSGVTVLPLQVGHVILVLARSDIVMVSSNGFWHVSHMNSYLGMVILLDQPTLCAAPLVPPGGRRCYPTGRRVGHGSRRLQP
jgi:hypothetical protein